MPAAARQAFVGLGANLGDRGATLRAALDALRKTPGITLVEPSAIYETAPVGLTEQPLFLNLVAGLETTLEPAELLPVLHQLERAAGRRRAEEIRWGPRTLDLDLLLYEGVTSNGPELILPHPRMWDRAFVTVPLRELIERSRRFQRPIWAEARARLASAAESPDVILWTAPKR